MDGGRAEKRKKEGKREGGKDKVTSSTNTHYKGRPVEEQEAEGGKAGGAGLHCSLNKTRAIPAAGT